MPIYEFRCGSCGERFEKLCSVGKDKGVRCPACGGQKSERLFSLFGVRSSSKSASGSGAGSSCSTCSGGTCSTCG
ncbi:MAG: zinc ribbon domain-containing protein [Candidatus Eiseniibacteriota bacterium]|nr:MAG: zinc ribbon domain-containing protein [Candidatus Eisenbacteria bacterium]